MNSTKNRFRLRGQSQELKSISPDFQRKPGEGIHEYVQRISDGGLEVYSALRGQALQSMQNRIDLLTSALNELEQREENRRALTTRRGDPVTRLTEEAQSISLDNLCIGGSLHMQLMSVPQNQTTYIHITFLTEEESALRREVYVKTVRTLPPGNGIIPTSRNLLTETLWVLNNMSATQQTAVINEARNTLANRRLPPPYPLNVPSAEHMRGRGQLLSGGNVIAEVSGLSLPGISFNSDAPSLLRDWYQDDLDPERNRY